MRRFTVHYSGSVQGVGFRFTAVRAAERYAVTGYVKNLRDGRVELVAEGEEGEVRAFLEAVADAMGGYIGEARTSESAASGAFQSFEVARG
jgi:acylphosphatase